MSLLYNTYISLIILLYYFNISLCLYSISNKNNIYIIYNNIHIRYICIDILFRLYNPLFKKNIHSIQKNCIHMLTCPLFPSFNHFVKKKNKAISHRIRKYRRRR